MILAADLCALYLAADSFGQLVHKFHDTGVLIGCGDLLYMVLQLLDQRIGGLIALCKHDGSLDHLTAYRVGCCGDSAFNNGGVLDESAFYLERSYAVAGALVISSPRPTNQ